MKNQIRLGEVSALAKTSSAVSVSATTRDHLIILKGEKHLETEPENPLPVSHENGIFSLLDNRAVPIR